MAWEGMESLIGSLASRDLILPYFETSILMENWPDEYNIKVDSRPYYGLGDGYFHPSTHALMGERQLYYLFHPGTRDKMVPERRSLISVMMLTMGSAIHAVLQTQMDMAGLIRNPKTDIEHEYRNDEHMVRGRIDWIVHHHNGMTIPVEFKTQNSWDFKRNKEPEVARPQLNLGMDALGLDFGIVLVAERGGAFGMHEYHVDRDQELIDATYAKFDRVRAAIAANEEPRYCCAPDSSEMKVCPARYECWLKAAR
jgi:hypothetical protein